MLTTKQIRGLIFDFWWIGALIAVLVLLGVVMWAFWGDPVREERDLHGNVEAANAQHAVVGNLVANQEGVINNAQINANVAGNALNASVNRPSTEFNSSGASDRFCRNFPADPRCKR